MLRKSGLGGLGCAVGSIEEWWGGVLGWRGVGLSLEGWGGVGRSKKGREGVGRGGEE